MFIQIIYVIVNHSKVLFIVRALLIIRTISIMLRIHDNKRLQPTGALPQRYISLRYPEILWTGGKLKKISTFKVLKIKKKKKKNVVKLTYVYQSRGRIFHKSTVSSKTIISQISYVCYAS